MSWAKYVMCPMILLGNTREPLIYMYIQLKCANKKSVYKEEILTE